MIRKGEVAINSLDVWRRLAGPKSPVQWQDYRSAKESARAWIGEGDQPGIPDEVVRVLCAHPDFGPITAWEAEPECLVAFDGYSGPANIDVLVTGHDSHDPFVMVIEAKADESFGPHVGRALADAVERSLLSTASRGVARIEELAHRILGPRKKSQPRLDQIRYQLLTATAAALSQAKQEGASRAVVMIHEFQTPRTTHRYQHRNSQDLLKFLIRLAVEDPERVLEGELLGPIHVPGGGEFQDPAALYIGKATRTVREKHARTPPEPGHGRRVSETEERYEKGQH